MPYNFYNRDALNELKQAKDTDTPNIKISPLKWLPERFSAITLYPYIYLREENQKENEVLINHERIHLAQQKELGLAKFLLLYCAEFVTRGGYMNISFEREAYKNQYDLKYLETRKPFAYKDY